MEHVKREGFYQESLNDMEETKQGKKLLDQLQEQLQIMEPYLCPEELSRVHDRMETFLRAGGIEVFGYGADLRHTLRPDEVIKMIRIQVVSLFAMRPELLNFSSFILCVCIKGYVCTCEDKRILTEQIGDCFDAAGGEYTNSCPEIITVAVQNDEKIGKTGFHMVAMG